jgi:hypothetical protein
MEFFFCTLTNQGKPKKKGTKIISFNHIINKNVISNDSFQIKIMPIVNSNTNK